jgi:hypothetical protein
MNQEFDTNDGAVFRFRLAPADEKSTLTLEEHYRQTLHDLLKVVRLFSNGEPVIIDSFTFHDDPCKRIRILDEHQFERREPVTGEAHEKKGIVQLEPHNG